MVLWDGKEVHIRSEHDAIKLGMALAPESRRDQGLCLNLPAAVEGTDIDRERAFSTAARYMKNRIDAFLNLPHASIDRLALQHHLKRIGSTEGATSAVLQQNAPET